MNLSRSSNHKARNFVFKILSTCHFEGLRVNFVIEASKLWFGLASLLYRYRTSSAHMGPSKSDETIGIPHSRNLAKTKRREKTTESERFNRMASKHLFEIGNHPRREVYPEG